MSYYTEGRYYTVEHKIEKQEFDFPSYDVHSSVHYHNEDESFEVVGYLKSIIVTGGMYEPHRVFDAFDSDSQDACNLIPGYNAYKRQIEENFEDPCKYLIGMVRMQIDKEHRRKGVGTFLASELVNLFEPSVVLGMPVGYLDVPGEEVCVFWRNFGMSPIEGTSVYVLNTAQRWVHSHENAA